MKFSVILIYGLNSVFLNLLQPSLTLLLISFNRVITFKNIHINNTLQLESY